MAQSHVTAHTIYVARLLRLGIEDMYFRVSVKPGQSRTKVAHESEVRWCSNESAELPRLGLNLARSDVDFLYRLNELTAAL